MEYVTTDVVTYVPEYTYVSEQPIKIYWWLVVGGMLLIAMGAYFFYRYSELRRLKLRCTQVYSAEITQIRKSKHADPHLRSKYMQYNATYRYEYNGSFYESSNNIYGNVNLRKPKVGDMATIYLDPDEPTVLFDELAKTRLNQFLIMGIGYLAGGIFCMFGNIIVRLFN